MEKRATLKSFPFWKFCWSSLIRPKQTPQKKPSTLMSVNYLTAWHSLKKPTTTFVPGGKVVKDCFSVLTYTIFDGFEKLKHFFIWSAARPHPFKKWFLLYAWITLCRKLKGLNENKICFLIASKKFHFCSSWTSGRHEYLSLTKAGHKQIQKPYWSLLKCK